MCPTNNHLQYSLLQNHFGKDKLPDVPLNARNDSAVQKETMNHLTQLFVDHFVLVGRSETINTFFMPLLQSALECVFPGTSYRHALPSFNDAPSTYKYPFDEDEVNQCKQTFEQRNFVDTWLLQLVERIEKNLIKFKNSNNICNRFLNRSWIFQLIDS